MKTNVSILSGEDHAVAGVAAISSFCFVYAWLCIRCDWKISLLLSWLLYFAVAFTIGAIALNLHQAAFISMAVLLGQIYFSSRLKKLLFAAPASNYEILTRMAFACILVWIITSFATSMGSTYSGVFAVFPIAGSTIALFSHRNPSSLHAVRSLKSMKQGLISMLLFFYVLVVLSHSLGFLTALVWAMLTSLGLQVVIARIRQNRMKV